MVDTLRPKFSLGKVVATPAAIESLRKANQTPQEFLDRHIQGDWGDIDAEDAALNDAALQPEEGSRLLSAYKLKTGETVWLITEAIGENGQRASTCVLLPSDY